MVQYDKEPSICDVHNVFLGISNFSMSAKLYYCFSNLRYLSITPPPSVDLMSERAQAQGRTDDVMGESFPRGARALRVGHEIELKTRPN